MIKLSSQSCRVYGKSTQSATSVCGGVISSAQPHCSHCAGPTRSPHTELLAALIFSICCCNFLSETDTGDFCKIQTNKEKLKH